MRRLNDDDADYTPPRPRRVIVAASRSRAMSIKIEVDIPSALNTNRATINWNDPPCQLAFVAFIFRTHAISWPDVARIFWFYFGPSLRRAEVPRLPNFERRLSSMNNKAIMGSRAAHAMYKAVPFEDLLDKYPILYQKLQEAAAFLEIDLVPKNKYDDEVLLQKIREKEKRRFSSVTEPMRIIWDVPDVLDVSTPAPLVQTTIQTYQYTTEAGVDSASSGIRKRRSLPKNADMPRVSHGVRWHSYPSALLALDDEEILPRIFWRAWGPRNHGLNSTCHFVAGRFAHLGATIPSPSEVIDTAPSFLDDVYSHLDRDNSTVETPFVSVSPSFILTLKKALVAAEPQSEVVISLFDTFDISKYTKIWHTGRKLQQLRERGQVRGMEGYRGLFEFLVYGEIRNSSILGAISITKLRALCEQDSYVNKFFGFDEIRELACKGMGITSILKKLPNNELDFDSGFAIGRLITLICESGRAITERGLRSPFVQELVRGFLQNWQVVDDLDSWKDSIQFTKGLSEGLRKSATDLVMGSSVHLPTPPTTPQKDRLPPSIATSTTDSITLRGQASDTLAAEPALAQNRKRALLSPPPSTPRRRKLVHFPTNPEPAPYAEESSAVSAQVPATPGSPSHRILSDDPFEVDTSMSEIEIKDDVQRFLDTNGYDSDSDIEAAPPSQDGPPSFANEAMPSVSPSGRNSMSATPIQSIEDDDDATWTHVHTHGDLVVLLHRVKPCHAFPAVETEPAAPSTAHTSKAGKTSAGKSGLGIMNATGSPNTRVTGSTCTGSTTPHKSNAVRCTGFDRLLNSRPTYTRALEEDGFVDIDNLEMESSFSTIDLSEYE